MLYILQVVHYGLDRICGVKVRGHTHGSEWVNHCSDTAAQTILLSPPVKKANSISAAPSLPNCALKKSLIRSTQPLAGGAYLMG